MRGLPPQGASVRNICHLVRAIHFINVQFKQWSRKNYKTSLKQSRINQAEFKFKTICFKFQITARQTRDRYNRRLFRGKKYHGLLVLKTQSASILFAIYTVAKYITKNPKGIPKDFKLTGNVLSRNRSRKRYAEMLVPLGASQPFLHRFSVVEAFTLARNHPFFLSFRDSATRQISIRPFPRQIGSEMSLGWLLVIAETFLVLLRVMFYMTVVSLCCSSQRSQTNRNNFNGRKGNVVSTQLN